MHIDKIYLYHLYLSNIMTKRFLSFNLFFNLFFLLLIIYFANLASAQELTPTLTPSTQATQSPIIKYDLAYPGILPDHPLYKLKVLRDKISVALINNPQKRIEFYLLKTDKGILATAMLVDKNKIKLAEETALKAENNYTLLTNELYNLPKKPDFKFFKKLKDASLKHQEVLNSLLKRVPQNERKTFETVLYFSKKNWQTVEEYQKPHSFSK